MKREERYRHVLDYFRQEMPEVTTELQFGSVFQLLVAVVLSAQCTDKRINQVTPLLFERYPDALSMAQAEADEVYEYVKSVSYPHAKAQHLVAMARALVQRHDGEVPGDMNQLLDLPWDEQTHDRLKSQLDLAGYHCKLRYDEDPAYESN